MNSIQNFASNDNLKSNNLKKSLKIIKALLKACLIAFLVIIGLIIIGIAGIEIIDHIPRVIAIQENDIYTVELQATSSPDWPFGSQDGRIVLKENSKIKSKINFILSNDGKGMRDGNWTVEWDSDKVAVTIMGEEQKDERYFLYYNGETKSVNSALCE